MKGVTFRGAGRARHKSLQSKGLRIKYHSINTTAKIYYQGYKSKHGVGFTTSNFIKLNY